MCVAKFCLDICYCYSNAELCGCVWSVELHPPYHPVIPAISSRFAISQFYFLSPINTGAKLISGDDFYPIVSRFIQWQPRVCLAQYLHWGPCLHPIWLGSAISLNLLPQYQYFRCRKSLAWNLTTCLYSGWSSPELGCSYGVKPSADHWTFLGLSQG